MRNRGLARLFTDTLPLLVIVFMTPLLRAEEPEQQWMTESQIFESYTPTKWEWLSLRLDSSISASSDSEPGVVTIADIGDNGVYIVRGIPPNYTKRDIDFAKMNLKLSVLRAFEILSDYPWAENIPITAHIGIKPLFTYEFNASDVRRAPIESERDYGGRVMSFLHQKIE